MMEIKYQPPQNKTKKHHKHSVCCKTTSITLSDGNCSTLQVKITSVQILAYTTKQVPIIFVCSFLTNVNFLSKKKLMWIYLLDSMLLQFTSSADFVCSPWCAAWKNLHGSSNTCKGTTIPAKETVGNILTIWQQFNIRTISEKYLVKLQIESNSYHAIDDICTCIRWVQQIWPCFVDK
jgi:hypothetical protein